MALNLPPGWEQKSTADGKTYFVDHNTKSTHWSLPPEVRAQAEQQQAPVIPTLPNAAPMPAAAPMGQTAPMPTATPMPAATPMHLQTPQPTPQPQASPNRQSAVTRATDTMGAICTRDLLNRAAEDEAPRAEKWSLQSPHMVEIQLNGRILARRGTMTAYRGKIKFERGSGGSMSNKLMKMATGEGPSMMKATGEGRLWLSDYCKNICILKLNNEAIIVNGNDILAWDDGMEWKITLMKGASGMLSGGLFNVKISGTGVVCFTTHGKPLVMVAGPNKPLVTDPQATVAWSAKLDPSLKSDVSVKALFGRGSGEELSMRFNGPGEGFVIVQPYEEIFTSS